MKWTTEYHLWAPCPYCGAAKGKRCRAWPSGRRYGYLIHDARYGTALVRKAARMVLQK